MLCDVSSYRDGLGAEIATDARWREQAPRLARSGLRCLVTEERCSRKEVGRWERTPTPLAPWLIPADHRDWPSRCLSLPRLQSGLFPEEVRADMAVQLALAGAPRGGDSRGG